MRGSATPIGALRARCAGCGLGTLAFGLEAVVAGKGYGSGMEGAAGPAKVEREVAGTTSGPVVSSSHSQMVPRAVVEGQ